MTSKAAGLLHNGYYYLDTRAISTASSSWHREQHHNQHSSGATFPIWQCNESSDVDWQRGNVLLDCIRNVGKEFGDIIADYQVGRTTGVLFLRFVLLTP
jgi:hypothetical protein